MKNVKNWTIALVLLQQVDTYYNALFKKKYCALFSLIVKTFVFFVKKNDFLESLLLKFNVIKYTLMS